MKPSTLFLLLAAGLVLLPQTSQGQRIADPPRAPGSLRINELVNAPRELPRTHWLEGGIAGGIGLGLFTAALAELFCDSDSNCSGATADSFVLGGGLGFVIGALVGGQFRKAPSDRPKQLRQLERERLRGTHRASHEPLPLNDRESGVRSPTLYQMLIPFHDPVHRKPCSW